MSEDTQVKTPTIELRHVEKHFGDLHVLKDINLQVEKGEVLVLIGPSGSGKSTLCRTINRLETIDSGEILIEGKLLPQEGKELAATRAEIGMVFQQFNLFAHKTILENVTMGPVEVLHADKRKAEQEAMELLRRVGVAEQAGKVPAQLSGGQQQRVALARALIIEPDILLLDEPLSALDRKIRAEMQYEIRRIQQQVGITTIFVTHDQEEAMTMSDEILLMRNGGIEQLSTPENIYNHPVSLYASDFLGKANTLIGTLHQAPDGWTVFGDGWKFPVEPQNGFADGEEVCLAIRGEQTRILDAAADGATAAEITDIVFTGEICRITARAGGATLSLACINVQAEHYRPGQTVYVLADRSKTHYFKK